MRRLGTEGWAGMAMLVVAIAVTVPVVVVADLALPTPLWVAVFVLYLAGMLVSTSGRTPVLWYGGLATAVVASWVLVLTARGAGLLLVLLVLTAAISVYVVPLRWGLGLAVLNTVLVAWVTWTGGGDLLETLIMTGFYLLIQAASALSSATLIREQRMRRQLAEANVNLRAAGILLEESARTAERLRISRELHDLIGHQLTVLTLELETARHRDPDNAREHLERADTVARALLGDVRTTVGQLRAEAPDLQRSLRRLADAVPGLDVTVTVDDAVSLDEEQSAALVRAAQEIVTNTLRHAEANQLWIDVVVDDTDAVVLRARDDGIGAATVEFGNGLRGLRERFTALGGDIAVDGSKGFAVTARVPA